MRIFRNVKNPIRFLPTNPHSSFLKILIPHPSILIPENPVSQSQLNSPVLFVDIFYDFPVFICIINLCNTF